MTKQRSTLTDAEHERLVEVGNMFWHSLGLMAASHVALMPAELRTLTTEYLQDRCSIYGSEYSDHLEKLG